MSLCPAASESGAQDIDELGIISKEVGGANYVALGMSLC